VLSCCFPCVSPVLWLSSAIYKNSHISIFNLLSIVLYILCLFTLIYSLCPVVYIRPKHVVKGRSDGNSCIVDGIILYVRDILVQRVAKHNIKPTEAHVSSKYLKM
jgi:hypothetical protein